MKLIIAAEFGSTCALEIFWFQGLFAGNGKNPFRLPCTPGVKPLHALGGGGVVPVTCTFNEPEVLLPGSGFVTLIANVPAVDALPVAVSFAEEIKVVESAAPARFTCAPETKLLPFTVIAKDPVGKVVGATLVSAGIGFNRVTVLESEAVASAALMAFTVTVFGFGKLAGGV